ncbi:hypothetical protein [Reichenbachiella ulvae]|uniref:Uncharacterized protein n=1 Tax=Reichenbachiella ulvae TaxID=2980104 RepID=A0ABT3CP39_9BACT|nr:hypothetical protein [Reichenbachiella ulvae]MCV9385336.1 hypothetical protein [Reichenbachiella ulvae]
MAFSSLLIANGILHNVTNQPLRGGKSYYRTDKKKEWTRPPHGYRMYVDAEVLE